MLIIVVCGALLALVANGNFNANKDAGGGWQYVYWQPWRVYVVVGTVVFLILMTAFIAVIGLLEQPTAT